MIAPEMRRIFRRQKGAFVMIEPPRNFRRTRILKVHDGVFVAIELRIVKERSCAMQQAGIYKLRIAPDAFLVETGEQSRRASSVETFVVIEHLHSQIAIPHPVSTGL